MGAIFWTLIVVHVVLCILLVLLVLVQNDKMGGLAGLGGMTAQSAFSTAGAATFIQKLTRYVALALFAVVLTLGVMATKQANIAPGSALQKEALTGQGAILSEDFTLPVE
ncbi:MAG: preprotein translocase subunit SecG [Fibromonadaceae bacterium]|jgi:preprotein translocase subunit SecG|nr:preprotein translocase subunit SecG [Fibromonadaceae bacterium]